METVMMKIKDVKPYPNNPRHNMNAVDKVAASIKEFGFQQPIVVDKDHVIIVGHTRLAAAKRLKLKEVPVVVAENLSDEQVRAYRLADNKTAEFSEWNINKLYDELEDIFDIDMHDFGFDIIEKDEVIEDEYEPIIPEEPKAKPGDVYILGRHRLMCGDATQVEDVDTLVDGHTVDMLLTDPPYGVDYNDKERNLASAGKAGKRFTESNRKNIENDKMDEEKLREFLLDAFSNARTVMREGAAFHIWYADSKVQIMLETLEDSALSVRQHLIWVKNNHTLSKTDFQRSYESVLVGDTWEEAENGFGQCVYGWKEGTHKWYKKRKERDVLYFDKPLASKLHPTMKPVKLFDYEMKCNTKPGDIVLDLFGGSGTTIMAAEQNDRIAYVMEKDPKFVDVIIDRWETFTGSKAKLED